MAKEIAGLIKLQIKGGAANPSPPVGPALGSKGINIMEFCKAFNARTQDKAGKVLPVIMIFKVQIWKHELQFYVKKLKLKVYQYLKMYFYLLQKQLFLILENLRVH